LIQDIQLDPVTDVLIHVDFLAVNKDEKVTTEIPVKMIGESMVEKLGELPPETETPILLRLDELPP
jgi:large subunit ribosomal protein L25